MYNEIHKLPLDKVDPPERPMRADFDPDGIKELADSIKQVGLIEPVVVKEVGERYEIVAGHRRYLAHQSADMKTIEARIVVANDEETETIKLHENSAREDINPVDEALWLQRLNQELGMSVQELCKTLHRSENYIYGRMKILEYQEDVLEYLYYGYISLGVAQALSRVKDNPTRQLYLNCAKRDGVTVNLANSWASEWERGGTPETYEEVQEIQPDGTAERRPATVQCELCKGMAEILDTDLIYVHRTCRSHLNAHMVQEDMGGDIL